MKRATIKSTITPPQQPRVAIFHDNFAQMGGAERVAESLQRALPGADLHTTLSVEEILTPYLQSRKIKTTWMQRLPHKGKLFRHYFMLYPFAIESADLRSYKVVVSSCFGYAKGVRRRSKDSIHICYCHNPMRWVWRSTDYIAREKMGILKRVLLPMLLKPLKSWELRASRQPDLYVANSKVVARRLKDAFNIDAEVICPPIDVARFEMASEIGDYYLVLSRLTSYKRIDLAVEACTRLGKKLIVLGDGAERKRLESLAGPTVTFLGRQSDDFVNEYASRCKALLFPGEEDFGITPLEINAAGRPVIAFRAGGATETIVDGVSGLFFNEQTVESLMEAIERAEEVSWDRNAIRTMAKRFDTAVFQEKILALIERVAPGAVPAAQVVPVIVPARHAATRLDRWILVEDGMPQTAERGS